MTISRHHGGLRWLVAIVAMVAAGLARVVLWPELFRDAETEVGVDFLCRA